MRTPASEPDATALRAYATGDITTSLFRGEALSCLPGRARDDRQLCGYHQVMTENYERSEDEQAEHERLQRTGVDDDQPAQRIETDPAGGHPTGPKQTAENTEDDPPG